MPPPVSDEEFRQSSPATAAENPEKQTLEDALSPLRKDFLRKEFSIRMQGAPYDGTVRQDPIIDPRIRQPEPQPLSKPPVLPHTRKPETETHERQMAQSDSVVIQNGTLFKGGLPYRPLSAAASSARTHRTTLLNWIKNKTPFAGRPLESYHLALANRYYVSEESIDRAANRFIKWQKGKPAGPAGPVTIGETRDKTGYIGITKAAQTIGVDHHTIWLWTAHGTAPTEKPLDVIKDPASDQFYIRATEIAQLKKLIPRSGLKRGRRPQLETPKP
jgi:hypothetical protein